MGGGGGATGLLPPKAGIGRGTLALLLDSPYPPAALYAGLVVLWFKEDVGVFSGLGLDPAWPLALLAGLLILRAARRLKGRNIQIPARLTKKAKAVILLLVLAAAVRVPFLTNGAGMMNSDDAIPALMGKHIAEGRTPPVNFYGQQYLGSFPSHIYALFFRIFGYSIFILKLVTLLAYLGFIALIFFFLDSFFGLVTAAVLSAFFVLPIGHLVLISFDNSAAFGFVLFFEAAILLAAQRIASADGFRRIPLLGFLMGLAFWTNQAAVTAIVAAGVYVVWKVRRRGKAFVRLVGAAILGALPLVFQEIFNGFQIGPFLFSGEKGGLNREKLVETSKLLGSLLSEENRVPFLAVGLMVLAGAAALAIRAVRSRGKDPVTLIVLFTVLFAVLFFGSRFSDKLLARYLYPLYAVLPVLLFAPLLWLKPRTRAVLISLFMAVLFIRGNGGSAWDHWQAARKGERVYRQVVEAMVETGRQAWTGSYWVAYLLTAIGGERIIVDSYTKNRYPAYRLRYYSDQDVDNFVFIGGTDTTDAACAFNLNNFLTAFEVPHEKKSGPEWTIIYAIPDFVPPALLWEEPPERIPEIRVSSARAEDGLLRLTFTRSDGKAMSGFGIKAEIPGHSAGAISPPPEAASAEVALPLPKSAVVPVRYVVDFRGLAIRSSAAEFLWDSPESGLVHADVAFLSGISEPMLMAGRNVRVLEQKVSIEASPEAVKKATLRLTLYSPLQFSDPIWYGRYAQSVGIQVGERPSAEIPLADGPNVVDIDLGLPPSGRRAVRVNLDFRYRFRFEAAGVGRVAAYLEKVEVLD